MNDMLYAIRATARRPLVTLVAVVSLSLGIGVNTVIFSIFEPLVLRQLPVPDPGSVVMLASSGPRQGEVVTGNAGDAGHVFTYPVARDLERAAPAALAGLGAFHEFTANLASGDRTERAAAMLVSGSYFPALNVVPALGRLFAAADDRIPGGHPIVVLSHAYWTSRFGASTDVVNQTLRVNGVPMTIVGVAPEGFNGTTVGERPQAFVPLSMALRMRVGSDQDNVHWLYAVGRLRPELTRDDASQILEAATAVRPLSLEDGSRGSHVGRAVAQVGMALLLGVAGLVLLIACVNLANIMLARASDRATEVAVRLSMGASTSRLIRLFMSEAALIGILGSVAAIVAAPLVLRTVFALIPDPDGVAPVFESSRALLLFTMVLGLLASVLFGLFPALHIVRTARRGSVALHGRATDTRSTGRFRTALATAQVTLATVLLATSGLFLSSLASVNNVDPGFDREGLIFFGLSPQANGYTPAETAVLFERIETELRGLPGVAAATASTVPLLSLISPNQNVSVEGFVTRPGSNPTTQVAAVGTGYFETIGIPLLAGREFSTADLAGRTKVAIVNEWFARRFNLGTNPLGRRLALGRDANALDIEIVGVVRDTKFSHLRQPAGPQLYLPFRQTAPSDLTFYARSTADASQLLSAVPAFISRIDPGLPVDRLDTMDAQYLWNSRRERTLASAASVFAAIATLLAALGLYGILTYSLTRRVREIGIRIAVGASPSDVRRLVFGYIGRIAATGGLIGLAVSLGLGRVVQGVLFGVVGHDPAVMTAALAGVLLVTVLAAEIPSRRAARLDPTAALRVE